MKRTILFLALLFAVPLMAQTSNTGRTINGLAAARPTCSTVITDQNAHNGDIYNDIDDVNTYKCNAGAWSLLGGGGGGGTPAAPNQSVQINSSGTFGPGPLVSTVAINPQNNDNICYVSQNNGNDANDGLSIGTGHAKLTVYSCLTTVLPGGNSTHAGNGTILLSGSPSAGGPVANQGIFLMGPNDPNYASPPSGWLKVNDGGQQVFSLTIDCFAQYAATANGNTGHCGLTAGSNGSPNLPAIWISAVAGNIWIGDIGFSNYVGNYIKIGIDSTGNRNGSGGSSGIALTNLAMNNGNCQSSSTQTGPAIDIGSNSFWIWLKRNTLPGCKTKIFAVANSGAVRLNNVTTITTTATNDMTTGELATIANVPDDTFNGSFVITVVDGTHFTYSNSYPNATSGTGQVVTARAAAINIDSGTTGAGSGLIFIDDTNLNGGNIRYKQGINGGGFYVNHVSYEGDFVTPDPPVVLITGTSATSNGDGTNIRVDNVEISDATNAAPGVQVDNPNSLFPDLVIVSRIAGNIRGKMSVLGNASVLAGPTNATYIRQQQYGMRNGQITATGIDVARRGFSPVAVRGINLANTSPSGWTFNSGAGIITSGITALDGTTNAGRVTYSSGTPGAVVQFYNSSTALNIGDFYIYGAWVRSFTANGFASSVPPLIFNFTAGGAGNGDGCSSFSGSPAGPGIIIGNASGPQQSDGQWIWYSGVCRVAANASIPGTFFGAQVDSTHTTDFYAPTTVLFPAGTISYNEAYEIALNMSPWASSAAIGEVSMLPNQRLHHGITTFANLGTPNNASDIYVTDAVANSNPCIGGGSGAFAQGINGAWVCGNGGGCSPGGTVDAIQYNGGGPCSFGGTNSPVVNGNYVVNYNVTASAPVPPTINLPGVPINPQTGTTYVEGSANTQSDRGYLTTANNAAAQTYTMGNPSASGFAFNYFNILHNIGAGAVTENASGFTVNGGTSLLVPPGWARWLFSDGTNYRAIRVPDLTAFPNCTGAGNALQFTLSTGVLGCGASSAGVSSWSGDGVFATNSASTAAVTMTLGTAPAHKFWMNNTGSTATPGYQSAGEADLPATTVFTDKAATFGAFLYDFSASTLKIPTAAGFTAGATTMIGYDTTNKNAHIYANNADAVVAAIPPATPPVNNDCAKWSVVSGTILLADAGAACGSGSGGTPTFDKTATGLLNPTADSTFTQPAASVTGWTLAGTAPASVSTATGTNATSLFNVNGVTGGADSNATGTAGVGSSPTLAAGNGGAGTGTNTVGGAGGTFTITAGSGGLSAGTGANSNGGNIVVTPGSAGTGGSGAVGHAGVFQVGAVECTVPGSGGGLCMAEGTEPTNVSGAATLTPDSTTHELMVAMNGASTSTPGMLVRSQPSPIHKTAQTASITTATLCAASAGACNQAGQYHVHFDFIETGTACSSVTAGSVTFALTWTDTNGTAHAAVILPMLNQTGATSVAIGNSFTFATALANAGASGDFTISTNGSVIQYATTYTACTTGTGTYQLDAAVTRVQ